MGKHIHNYMYEHDWKVHKLGNTKEQTYTPFSRDKYGKVQVWKHSCRLLFHEIIMEMYKYGNMEEQIYFRLDGDKFRKVQLWK